MLPARQPLVTEVGLALGLEAADAETVIDALPGLEEGQRNESVLSAGRPHDKEPVAIWAVAGSPARLFIRTAGPDISGVKVTPG